MLITLPGGYGEGMAKEIERALQSLAPSPKLNGVEWMDKYYRLARGSTGTPGRWTTRGYQRGLIFLTTNFNTCRLVMAKKSRRIGWTCILIGSHMYHIRVHGVSTGLWFPNKEDHKLFVGKELDPAIGVVHEFNKVMPRSHTISGDHNSIHVKKAGGVLFNLMAGGTRNAYTTISVAVVSSEETSSFPLNIAGEGSPLKLMDGRTDQAPQQKAIHGSTIKGDGGLVVDTYDRADIRLARYIPCPFCGAFSALKRSSQFSPNFKEGKPLRTTPCCGKQHDWYTYREQDDLGIWAEVIELEYVKDFSGMAVLNEENGLIERDGIYHYYRDVGVSIWAAYSYNYAWSSLMGEYCSALDRMKGGDDTEMETFLNQLAAELYKGDPMLRITGEEIKLFNREPMGEKIPDDVLVIFAAIDVQASASSRNEKTDRIEIEVAGFGANRKRWSFEYTKIMGHISDQSTKDAVIKHFAAESKVYETTTGRKLVIQAVMVDTGGSVAEEVRKLIVQANEAGLGFRGVKGDYRGDIAHKAKFHGSRTDGSRCKINVLNTYRLKAIAFQYLRTNQACWFPPDRSTNYFRSLLAEEEVVKVSDMGRKSMGWASRVGSHRNEGFDLFCYTLSALYVFKVNLNIKLKEVNRWRISQGLTTLD